MAAHPLVQLVKAGMPTFYSMLHNTYLMINLVFASAGCLTENLIKCWTSPGHGSDHNAVHTTFDITIKHRDPPLCCNFRAADWNEYPALFKGHFVEKPLPALPLSTTVDIDAFADALTQGMVETLERHVPLRCPSPHTHRWWNKSVHSPLHTAYGCAH
ncbi:hypothetical protein B0H17DRAFT_926757 [Mycena rosella]|uniref:Uncharacterized protein n=1 Tax=Mycena rosella TaxID=1033263 RepID=A0AAD7DW20_MYCRO|nr:hypothetical protein B0H17DRAFT_926757 [Mycena rosella]